jgi:hypothetical protein
LGKARGSSPHNFPLRPFIFSLTHHDLLHPLPTKMVT